MRATSRTVELARTVRSRVREPLPTLRTALDQRHPSTVYFCQPDINIPSGGIRVAYRHVDLLNKAEIPAAVLHARANFRCTWFENRTRVASSRSAVIGPHDVVVVSEIAAGLLQQLPPGFRYVVFNQNAHWTWKHLSQAAVRRYIDSPDLAAIVTVSDHSAEMLRHMAPRADVIRLRNSLDPAIFHPARHRPRQRTIAFMPRRGRDEARQVVGILRARGALEGWDVVELAGLCERGVADALRSTSVFMSFSYQEGFGLPAAEAMACGAYVVGFHGFAGREFLRPEFSSPIEPGDVLEFARRVEHVLWQEELDPGWCQIRGQAASAFVAEKYSPDHERRDVVNAYRSVLSNRRGDRPSQRHGRPHAGDGALAARG